MSETRYSTALAHFVSAGASIWAIKAVKNSLDIVNFPFGSFGAFLINSALGVLTFGNPEHGIKLRRVYGHTLFLCQCFGLPCIAAQICMKYHVQHEVAYLHLGASLIPILAHFLQDKNKKTLLNFVIVGNLISVAYFCYVNTNHYGFAMVVSYAVNNFLIGTEGLHFDSHIPSLDLFMYGLCFFYYFATKTLLD